MAWHAAPQWPGALALVLSFYLDIFDRRLVLDLKALQESPPIPDGEADEELWYNQNAATYSVS